MCHAGTNKKILCLQHSDWNWILKSCLVLINISLYKLSTKLCHCVTICSNTQVPGDYSGEVALSYHYQATILDLTNWQQRSGTGSQLTNEYFVTGDYYGERSHLTSWHWATNDDWLTYVPGHYCGERRLQRETGFGAQPHFGAILGGFGVQSGAILGARLNWAEDCWAGEYRGPSVVGKETCMEWYGKSCCEERKIFLFVEKPPDLRPVAAAAGVLKMLSSAQTPRCLTPPKQTERPGKA